MNDLKRLPARFWQADSGRVPVRDWLLVMDAEDRRRIGEDIRTAEFGWPIGMPLCRKMKGHSGLWEIRTDLGNGRIARVFFTVAEDSMVLLHGFIKKSQKTPQNEIETALNRMRGLRR